MQYMTNKLQTKALRYRRQVSAILLVLCMTVTFLGGCQKPGQGTASSKTTAYNLVDPSSVDSDHTLGGTGKKASEQKAFDSWCQEQFAETMQEGDTVSLHYMLKNPKKYGIEEKNISYGDISLEKMQEDQTENAQCRKELSTFDYKMLTQEQQITYDALKFNLELSKQEKGMELYSNLLSPDLGVPANVPVNLAEYPIRSEKDVETYLILLTKLPEYFKQLAEYEQKVSQEGLFISDDTLKDTLKQMNDFIAEPDKNYLITTFAERLGNIKGLSETRKKEICQANETNIKQYVIPAYQQLIQDLTALKGTGKNEGGLCNYPKGKKYYEYLLKYYTCSDMTVDEVWKLLENRCKLMMKRMSKLVLKNSDLLDEYENLSYKMTDPDEILQYLSSKMQQYFPPCPAVNYTVKHVDSSLAESLSPAFYMVPQIDDYKNNVIYINDASSSFDKNDLYSTLAHEGFPGHLYQTTYYDATNPAPIRQMLDYGGYSEGWATYVELSSYELINFGKQDKDLTDMCQIESEISLALSSLADIGVNAKGWDKAKLKEYLDQYGMGDQDTVDQIFTLVVEDPGNYQQYYTSYLEFWNLRCKAKEQLKDKFDTKEFHKTILDCGPAPFTVLEKQVEKYIAQGSGQQ